MTALLETILAASFHGSIVILAVLVLRLILRSAPKKYICLLWMLAGLRLLLPIPVESAYSLQPRDLVPAIPAGLSTVLWILWALLAAAISLYSAASYLHLRRKVRNAVKIPGGWEAANIETAFVLGFLRPRIYIPAGMSPEIRNLILAHERTHLEKGDHWVKILGFAALAVHWFNPLVWLSYILLCKDMEMACDERVVRFMELSERKAYSSALLQCSTNRAYYAASPVAFGEINVKYRIRSILNYRKPSFWLSLAAIAGFLFIGVCLMTSPQNVVEVPVDADVPLRQISREDPAAFVPARTPEMEENPDWGVDVILDAASPNGGTLVYVVEERFAAASDSMDMRDAYLERWNGTAWEPLPSRTETVRLLEATGIGFAQSRDARINYFETDLHWTLVYGALDAGDYRICQTIDCALGSGVFRAAFHIYREALPSDQEAALKRCEAALSALAARQDYAVLLSETAPDGQVYPVKQITASGDRVRIDHYLGDALVSSNSSEGAVHYASGWESPFRLDQNRQFLFPEGQSVIGQEEITFCSVWADYKGTSYRGTDTFRFQPDGSLLSVERLVQTLDSTGAVVDSHTRYLEWIPPESLRSYSGYISAVGSYETQDAFDTTRDSPWNIFFRVDDDLLSPGGGEVWLGADVIGVSSLTTDGSYWLEKKVGRDWVRLGADAAWGEETIPLVSQTSIRQVDWSKDFGTLEAGLYRMGKHFYNGTESIIQYAEFAIYQTGGVFGQGSQEALARVDAALEAVQAGNYRVEQYESCYSTYGEGFRMTQVHWKYGDTMVVDFYNKADNYSHSAVQMPGDILYGTWLQRSSYESEYDSIYFPAGYGLISDREIRLAYAYSRDSADNPCILFTYRFDADGTLTEIERENLSSMWGGYVTRCVITETPEIQIRAWVEEQA